MWVLLSLVIVTVFELVILGAILQSSVGGFSYIFSNSYNQADGNATEVVSMKYPAHTF